jgi:hypothetical protein
VALISIRIPIPVLRSAEMIRFISLSTLILLSIAISVGCSNGKIPLLPADNTGLNNGSPLTGVASPGDINDNRALFGAYNLTLDPETKKFELVQGRTADFGESYLVNGKSFFTIAPCEDCFNIKSISWETTGIKVTFNLKHPFDQGNTSLPPTAKNRLDLDVFDMALLVRPLNATNQYFTLLNKLVPTAVVTGQDGFTSELQTMLIDNTALPYFLAIDDSETGVSTYNKFAQGADVDFDVDFMKVSNLQFELFLTMGYGFSAKLATRLAPLYFNPEYNKKAAWKVEVEPLGYWKDDDSINSVYVEVKVYDWQSGATVYPTPDDFENAPSDNVWAASEVLSVSVEIPGMTNTLNSVTSPASGSGTPGNPLVFRVPIKNSNLIAEGSYTGLTKVLDSRPCLTPTEGRDFLVDSPDGVTFENYSITEYATYQSFKATVAGDSGWVKTWGSPGNDNASNVVVDDLGFIYVTGSILGNADMDPDPDIALMYDSGDDWYGYISKFDPGGRLIWVDVIGGPGAYTAIDGIAVDSEDRVAVSGSFSNAVDFDPDPNTTDIRISTIGLDNFLWLLDSSGNYRGTSTFGGTFDEYNHCLTMDDAGNCYVGGYFGTTVDFDPSDGVAERTANGGSDAYLCAFDPDGIYLWVQTWGGAGYDNVGDIAVSPLNGQIMVTGRFEQTVDFDPTLLGNDPRSAVGKWDIYYSLFDSDGTWIKSATWGGLEQDLGLAVACDQSGNFYVGGYFRETMDVDPGGGINNKTSLGGTDCFLSKFDSTGLYLWNYIWGGSYDDEIDDIAFDIYGNFYVCGIFGEYVDFDPSLNVAPDWGGYEDAYVSKFDNTGTFMWVDGFGGSGWDGAYSVATYHGDFVYVAGGFYATVDFDPNTQYQETHSNGLSDAYLLKLRYNGTWE